jgi:arylsulfatase A-like enzyme
MRAKLFRLLLIPLALGALTGCGEPGDRTAGAAATTVALEEHGTFGLAEGFDLLLITLDTVRADHLGCYGHAGAATPVIDRLAARGLRFDQTLSAAPTTLPSHCSIMTGLYAPRHGVRDNGYYRLGSESTTLAETLRERGYTTAAFIAAYVLDERYGLGQGFDLYDDSVLPSAAGETRSGYNERPADAVTDRALAWLEAQLSRADSERWFAWVHYFDAHWPYRPPAEYARRFPGRPYDGEIAFVDAQIGRLVELLERSGRLDRTLVVVTADHGDGLGEHGETTHSLFVYDSTMRVPWILSSPALFERPVVVADRVTSVVDIAPTLLDLLGIERQRELDGINPLASPADGERAVYVETLATLTRHGYAPLHGLRRLRDKYIHAPRPEYYDLAEDPGEATNLFEARPERSRELVARLSEMMAPWEEAHAALDRALPLEAEQRRRLAALGYVESRPSDSDLHVGDPKDLVPHFGRVQAAKDLSDAGRHAEALVKIGQAIDEIPNEPYAWKISALLHQRVGQSGEAESALRRVLELQPDVESHVRLAQLLVRRGAYAECAQQLDLAETLDPLHGDIYITRGDLYALQGRFESALEEFRRAERVDPIRRGADARKGIAQAQAMIAREREAGQRGE